MKTFLTLFVLLALTACSADSSSFVFRDDARPSYERSVSVEEMKDLRANGAIIMDVRLEEDFAENPNLIKGASYNNPENISEWASRLPKDKPIIVYCVKGKWVSQKAATYLHNQNFDVYSLRGGIIAWEETNVPTKSSEEND